MTMFVCMRVVKLRRTNVIRQSAEISRVMTSSSRVVVVQLMMTMMTATLSTAGADLSLQISAAAVSVPGLGLTGLGPGSVGASCPRVCFCNSPSRIVYCSRRGLAAIPEGVSTDSSQLNLNGNAFHSTTIVRSNLSSFIALEHLYLSECQLEYIEIGAFGDLAALRWLDLSNNRLKMIRPNTFSGLHLQHLFLNGNRNIQLVPDSFAGLVTTGLYLHDCSLTSISPDVVHPLSATLRYLWLNGNELDRFDRRLADSFSRLNHIRLGSNPLRCGCDSVWLKRFYDRHADAFRGAMAPSCLHPSRLRGRLFSELTLHDLRCQAPSFTALEAHFFDVTATAAEPGSHVTSSSTSPSSSSPATVVRLRCAAVGDPVPTLYWIRPNGRTTRHDRIQSENGSPAIRYPERDESQDDNENEAVLELSSATSSSLHESAATSGGSQLTAYDFSGTYTCIANNEAGNVTLTVNVPAQQAHISTSLASARKFFHTTTTAQRLFRPATSSPIRHHPDTWDSPTSESAIETLSTTALPSDHDTSIQSSLLGDSLLHLRRLQLNAAGTKADGRTSHDPSYRFLDGVSASGNRSKSAARDNHDDETFETSGVATGNRHDDPFMTSSSTSPARFSSGDMAWAVVCTHVATLVLCIVAALVCRAAGGFALGRRSGGRWFSIYRVSASRRRNRKSSSPSVVNASTSGGGSGTGSSACRALRAAYERRRVQNQWTAATHVDGGSKTDCSEYYDVGGGGDGPAITGLVGSCPALDSDCRMLTPSSIVRAATGAAGETVYLNGVGRYQLPSYTTDAVGMGIRGRETTYTTFSCQR